MNQTIQIATSSIEAIKNIIGNPWLPVLISSFLGAFFAFLFVRIEDSWKRISVRKKQNYNALVQIEYMGNENLSVAHDNIFIAEDIIRTSKITLETKAIQINFNNFEDLIVRNELLSELLDIDFINICFMFNTGARKLNSSMKSVMKSYEQINAGIFGRTMPLDNYLKNLSALVGHLTGMIKILRGFIEEDKKMIATARVLMKYEKPKFTKFLNIVLRNKNRSLAEMTSEIEAEKKRLDEQIEEVAQKAKKRIDELLGKS